MVYINYTATIHVAPEGGYWAEVPSLPGCFTQGESIEDVVSHLEEAVESYLAGLAESGAPLPVEKRVTERFKFPVSVRLPQPR